MKPNVEIVDGKFRTIIAVKRGGILLHPDWPLGLAARNIEAGEIIEYKPDENTKDVVVNANAP